MNIKVLYEQKERNINEYNALCIVFINKKLKHFNTGYLFFFWCQPIHKVTLLWFCLFSGWRNKQIARPLSRLAILCAQRYCVCRRSKNIFNIWNDNVNDGVEDFHSSDHQDDHGQMTNNGIKYKLQLLFANGKSYF